VFDGDSLSLQRSLHSASAIAAMRVPKVLAAAFRSWAKSCSIGLRSDCGRADNAVRRRRVRLPP
jgi:hypothetical protein